MTKSELVHERACVWSRPSAHTCVSFHLLRQMGQTYMWKCVLGDGSRLSTGERGRGGDLVSRSHFLHTLKSGSLHGYFSLAAAKIHPLQSGSQAPNLATTCAPPAPSLFMRNCNRPHIRTDHSCSSQRKYFVPNMPAKTNSLAEQTVFHAETKKKTDTQPPPLSRGSDFYFKPNRELCVSARFLLIIMHA